MLKNSILYEKIKIFVMIPVIIIHLLVLALKMYGYRITGSSAIFSDALEGIVNFLASLISFGSLWWASLPADASHPYGHGKIEYFSIGFEGAFIIAAAAAIVNDSIPKLINPSEVQALYKGLGLITSAALLQICAVVLLYITGKKYNSPALIGETHHILSDVLSTASVIGGLLLAKITKFYRIDAIVALGIAVYILFLGLKLVRTSFRGLMDSSDEELRQEVAKKLQTHRSEYWIDIHQLRVRRLGSWIHIDFHLILPRNFHLWQAHLEAKKAEEILKQYLGPTTEVLIHIDPCESPHCNMCRKYECEHRKETYNQDPIWIHPKIFEKE